MLSRLHYSRYEFWWTGFVIFERNNRFLKMTKKSKKKHNLIGFDWSRTPDPPVTVKKHKINMSIEYELINK